MGWDDGYQRDPVTGQWSGPYEAWQVIGCVLSLLAALAGAVLAGVRPTLASVALTLAFTATWTWQAAREDSTGMFGVGAALLLIGLGIGTTLVSLVTTRLRDRWRPRRDVGPAG